MDFYSTSLNLAFVKVNVINNHFVSGVDSSPENNDFV